MSKPIGSRKAATAYSDIDMLAQHVDGFDAQQYFDQQVEVETVAAAQRWPLLARVMGCAALAEAEPAVAVGPSGGG
ncbi:BcsR/BcsP family cellulose biosynthesis protein [Cupriavidus metallidurans]|uniref:Cellulose biosynthesis protein BcsR n=1 Tax=Cupriavidus metallidurans (strain ATCC 43123 / DSM 2839 / NBRC 102507 / CH34) TaxID=266264 RepID=Q1LL39_CUPMC|nr:BcsR/BcsP family cellulose biosynthesis protein [Cupriavidus metallidurans]ABF09137.1 hypothetical protein Rmet_2258 [Cupriavidus metallidurans CH34]QGS29978.1 hypothetical protein FOB83_14380 [Cupriavidus metallidurans]UBM09956.1 hypothetical protein LAI70_22020 [Cupriavidus metallidurans]